MNKTCILPVVLALIALVLPPRASACTVLLYTDAKGLPYVGRTMEFVGSVPDRMTYYPAGSRIESVTPGGQPGKTFDTKYAILAVTAYGLVPDAKQDTLHEATNDQGLTFTTNSLSGNKSPDVAGVPADQVLSGLDLGTWALGNFATVAEVKEALAKKEVAVWLPEIPFLGDGAMPLHFALFDKTGAGIVIEWTDGQTTVYDNPVGVMTNNPPFPWHLANMQNYAYLTNIDKNRGRFNKLEVQADDSGGNMASLPGSETSPGRFVKAAYYANFAHKAETPEQAIFTLGHVMNNFDRPQDISKDLEDDLPAGERSMEATKGPKSISEVTSWTVLHDLAQGHFYLRTINALNFSKFDLGKLSVLKAPKEVTLDAVNANTQLEATDLF
jgi:Penicillin V acylase and related amidases